MANLPKGKISFTLVFSETSPWSSIFAFERDFSKYFAFHGWDAYKIPGPENDQFPVIWLSKMDNKEMPEQPTPPKTVSKQMDSLTKKMMKGK